MQRYYASLQVCPRCQHSWASQMPDSIMNLQKVDCSVDSLHYLLYIYMTCFYYLCLLRQVDFFWINRNQRSFEWFVNMLSNLEMEQAEMGGVLDRFLDLHMYITSALKKTDMKAIGLQMALDLLHAKVLFLFCFLSKLFLINKKKSPLCKCRKNVIWWRG